MEKTIAVHWQLRPIKLQFYVHLQRTAPETEDPTYIITIQLQQCVCCPVIRMKVFEAHKEPY